MKLCKEFDCRYKQECPEYMCGGCTGLFDTTHVNCQCDCCISYRAAGCEKECDGFSSRIDTRKDLTDVQSPEECFDWEEEEYIDFIKNP